MNLLFAIDDHYLEPLMTTLFSIAHNNAHRPMVVYVIQKERLKETDRLISLTNQLNMTYHPLIIGDTGFSGAKVSKRYPEAVYYRLLAHRILPKDLDRVLYLDADILCINDLSDLYHLDLTDQEAFAAADHAKLLAPNMKFHKYRLQVDSDHYYNSGVLLRTSIPILKLMRIN